MTDKKQVRVLERAEEEPAFPDSDEPLYDANTSRKITKLAKTRQHMRDERFRRVVELFIAGMTAKDAAKEMGACAATCSRVRSVMAIVSNIKVRSGRVQLTKKCLSPDILCQAQQLYDISPSNVTNYNELKAIWQDQEHVIKAMSGDRQPTARPSQQLVRQVPVESSFIKALRSKIRQIAREELANIIKQL